MKPHDELISLRYNTIEFLIEKNRIVTASLCKQNGSCEFDFDKAALLYKCTFQNSPHTLTSIQIKNGDQTVTALTSALCRVVNKDDYEPKKFCGVLENYFCNNGILACSFLDGGMQLLVEPIKFLEACR